MSARRRGLRGALLCTLLIGGIARVDGWNGVVLLGDRVESSSELGGRVREIGVPVQERSDPTEQWLRRPDRERSHGGSLPRTLSSDRRQAPRTA